MHVGGRRDLPNQLREWYRFENIHKVVRIGHDIHVATDKHDDHWIWGIVPNVWQMKLTRNRTTPGDVIDSDPELAQEVAEEIDMDKFGCVILDVWRGV